MAVEDFFRALGDEVQDVDQDLGMLNGKEDEVDVSINGRDFTIKQSPGALQSRREGGTTGAALWRACVLFAEWLGAANNPLFKHSILSDESTVLELGSGISGLVPMVLGSRVNHFVATDQQYALKLLEENIASNLPTTKRKNGKKQPQSSNIDILALDWETSDIRAFLWTNGLQDGIDAVLVCDCVFNYALIKPLTQTFTEICAARPPFASGGHTGRKKPTLCIVAQQLRQPEVFEEWLKAFLAIFHVWRLPDGMLSEDLKEGNGFVVHIGVIRNFSVSD